MTGKTKWQLAHPKRVKELRHEYYLKNKQKEKDRAVLWQLKHPHKTIFTRQRAMAKYKGRGFNLIVPNPYIDTNIKYVYHHVDEERVIAIPSSLHWRYINNQHQTIHKQMVNAWIEVIYGINLGDIFAQ